MHMHRALHKEASLENSIHSMSERKEIPHRINMKIQSEKKNVRKKTNSIIRSTLTRKKANKNSYIIC
jgi:hypothetical protein